MLLVLINVKVVTEKYLNIRIEQNYINAKYNENNSSVFRKGKNSIALSGPLEFIGPLNI